MPAQTVRATSLESLLAGLRLGLFLSSASGDADAAALSQVADWRTLAELARFHHVPGLLLQGLETVPGLSVASRLWFGVRKAEGDADEMEYHAWLAVDGECVLGGGAIETFTALPPFDAVPGAKSWRGMGRSPHCADETRM